MVERGPRLENFGHTTEAPAVDSEATPTVAVPELSQPNTTPEISQSEPVEVTTATPRVSEITAPSIEAIASGAQSADIETTQSAINNVFECNIDHAA